MNSPKVIQHPNETHRRPAPASEAAASRNTRRRTTSRQPSPLPSPPRDLRYEIKLPVPGRSAVEAVMWLRRHPAGFREVYAARQVNNLYLDTPDLDSLQDNHCGAAIRTKLRLRWYGHDPRAVGGTLELKCKRDHSGWKLQDLLHRPKDLTRWRWTDVLDSIRVEASPRLRRELDARFWPTLLNQYQRRYFVSADGQVRVTLDGSLQNFDQRLAPRPNLTRRHPQGLPAIIELKADLTHRAALADAAAGFPLRPGRCSKYHNGMDGLLLNPAYEGACW